VSGGAIMGDGRISLILDIEGIISAATNSKQWESNLIRKSKEKDL